MKKKEEVINNKIIDFIIFLIESETEIDINNKEIYISEECFISLVRELRYANLFYYNDEIEIPFLNTSFIIKVKNKIIL